MATTWNPADKSAWITLSGGDLTATQTDSEEGAGGARGTTAKAGGKVCIAQIVGDYAFVAGFGIATAGHPLTTQVSESYSGSETAIGISSGLSSSDVIKIYVDFDSGDVAIDVNDVEALTFSGVGGGPWYPFCNLQSTEQATLDPNPTGLRSGFVGWDAVTEVQVPAASLTLAALPPLVDAIVPAAGLTLTALTPTAELAAQVPTASLMLSALAPGFAEVYGVPLATLTLTGLAPAVEFEVPATALRTAYRVYLTDGVTPVEVPAKSFQSRLQDGAPSYVSVVLPYTVEVSDILAGFAADTDEIVVYKEITLTDGTTQRSPIARAVYQDLRTDLGARNASLTISGYGTYATSAPQTRTVRGITYQSASGGRRRWRCEVDQFARPGDTITDGDTSFVAGEIVQIVGPTLAYMEVAEANG